MTLNDTDKFLVNDGTKTETITFAQYKDGTVLNDTDKFLVNDGTKTETVTWATLKAEGGGGGGGGTAEVEFLVIGGGAPRFNTGQANTGSGGGGAGGYISSVIGEQSGGGEPALLPLTVKGNDTIAITIGAAGSSTTFGDNTALGGGVASGNGGVYPNGSGNPGTTGQGFKGGDGTDWTGSGGSSVCTDDPGEFACNQYCASVSNGGGGGAGAAGNKKDGGDGVESSITGTATYYAGGGNAISWCTSDSNRAGAVGQGQENYGGGGGWDTDPKDGAVILRYDSSFSIEDVDGGLTISSSVVGPKTVSVITAGSGSLKFIDNSGPVSSYDLDFVVVGGGGGGGVRSQTNDRIRSGGGGGGGYLNSFGDEPSGGNSATLPKVAVANSSTFTITVGAGGAIGANGANSVFSGVDKDGNAFDFTAIGGGYGAGPTDKNTCDGGVGGSSGGAGAYSLADSYPDGVAGYVGTPVAGTANQGSAGGGPLNAPRARSAANCSEFKTEYWCWDVDNNPQNYGAGGGGGAFAAGPDQSGDGGEGIASTITGVSTYMAGGGAGEGYNQAITASPGLGQDSYGGGGNAGEVGKAGAVILRVPQTCVVTWDAGELTGSTSIVDGSSVTVFTAGSGDVSVVNSAGGGDGCNCDDVTGDKFDLDLVVIGGGGLVTPKDNATGVVGPARGAGGGAGGYISTVSGEQSGGGTPALPALSAITGKTYSITIGAAGSDTVFDSPGWYGTDGAYVALAGGQYNTPEGKVGDGGSGSGNVPQSLSELTGGGPDRGPGGLGTPGQGFDGGNSGSDGLPSAVCLGKDLFCYETCVDHVWYSGGGGAGSAGNVRNGGDGVQSSITGTPTYYAAGGSGGMACTTSSANGTSGQGKGNFGSGGGDDFAAQDGAIILRYPTQFTLANPGGGLTIDTNVVGDNNVSVVSAGTGSISFTSS